MRGFAARTDAFVKPPATAYDRRDSYTIVHTDAWRDYQFGNLLILDEPPEADDLDRWLSAWQAEFAEIEGIQRRILQQDAPKPMKDMLREAARAHGLEAEPDEVLVSVRPPPEACVYEARPLRGERE